MIWPIYGHRIFPCIRRIQKRKQPDLGFYSIFLRIDDKNLFIANNRQKKTLYFKKRVEKCLFWIFYKGFSREKWCMD